jgi:hypothetical protein
MHQFYATTSEDAIKFAVISPLPEGARVSRKFPSTGTQQKNSVAGLSYSRSLTPNPCPLTPEIFSKPCC